MWQNNLNNTISGPSNGIGGGTSGKFLSACEPNPCLNDGVCKLDRTSSSGYRCECKEAHHATHDHCQKTDASFFGQGKQLEIIFRWIVSVDCFPNFMSTFTGKFSNVGYLTLNSTFTAAILSFNWNPYLRENESSEEFVIFSWSLESIRIILKFCLYRVTKAMDSWYLVVF